MYMYSLSIASLTSTNESRGIDELVIHQQQTTTKQKVTKLRKKNSTKQKVCTIQQKCQKRKSTDRIDYC